MDHVQIKGQAGRARGQAKIWNTVRRLEPQEAQSLVRLCIRLYNLTTQRLNHISWPIGPSIVEMLLSK